MVSGADDLIPATGVEILMPLVRELRRAMKP